MSFPIYAIAAGNGFRWDVLTVTGYGKSEHGAILDGVEEAIKREYGFFLSAKKFNSDMCYESENKSLSKDLFESKIREKFRGTIDKYKVISSLPCPEGNYKVKLKVYIVKYTPPGISINQRRRMAVYPFEAENNNIKSLLTQAIVNYLTQSRKFSVLDRENFPYYKKEKALILSKNANTRERLKLKHLAGTDYILIGNVAYFRVYPIQLGSKLLKITQKGFRIDYSVNYRVLMFSTGQVKYSNTQEGNFIIKSGTKREAIEKATDKIAKRIITDLLLDIYPPVVIAQDGEMAVLNVGDKLILPDSYFNVYKKGKLLIDPYTKECLGYDEIKIGKVQVVEIKPKFSKAQLIKGYIVKGAILRPSKHFSQDSEIHREKSSVKLLPSGGVMLPGDR